MWGFMAQLGKQILLGVGMAAGQAIVETGQQVTVNALQKQMSKWGVSLDSDSVLGMFSENLKNNLGFQASFMIMNATDKIMDSQLDKLREASLETEKAMALRIKNKIDSLKAEPGKISFWKHPSTLFKSKNAGIESVYGDQLNEALTKERARLQEEGKQFLEHRKTTGAIFNGLAVGSGTINTSNNHNFSDDTKIFDAVMMMMNMKKVG